MNVRSLDRIKGSFLRLILNKMYEVYFASKVVLRRKLMKHSMSHVNAQKSYGFDIYRHLHLMLL